jgi:hypothetical protein
MPVFDGSVACTPCMVGSRSRRLASLSPVELAARGANAETVVGHRKQQPVALPPRRNAYSPPAILGSMPA